jgi:CBS domain containing-hemolysin-like protein
MTDTNPPSTATTGSQQADQQAEQNQKPGLWARLRAALSLQPVSLRDNITEALEDQTVGTGTFSANERILLQNVLKLREMGVDDVMVPRADIEAIEVGQTMAELIASFHAAGHSRLPVYAENLDNVLGFVHIKDALQRLTEINAMPTGKPGQSAVKLLSPVLRQKVGNKDMVRKCLFVPPAMPVGDLLQKMQASRVHMAIVVDEYGGTDGLVTIEDLLEAVVGDIEDEHDDADEVLIKKVDELSFIADARIELSILSDVIGSDFDPGAHGDDVETLGGLIFDLIDRVPVRGEVITRLKGFEFEILQADARRIRKVRIVRRRRALRPRATASASKKPDTPTPQTPARADKG